MRSSRRRSGVGGQVDERAGNPPHHSALFYCTPLQVHSTTAIHSTPYSNHFTANRQHPIPPHIHAPHICGQDHPPYKIYAKNGIVTIVRFKRAVPPYVLGPKVTIVDLRTSQRYRTMVGHDARPDSRPSGAMLGCRSSIIGHLGLSSALLRSPPGSFVLEAIC